MKTVNDSLLINLYPDRDHLKNGNNTWPENQIIFNGYVTCSVVKIKFHKEGYDIEICENPIRKFFQQGLKEKFSNIKKVIITFWNLNFSNYKTITGYFKEYCSDLEESAGVNLSKAMKERHECILKHLQNFIFYQYKDNDFMLADINKEFITCFEVYLLFVVKCSNKTAARYIQSFRQAITAAQEKGLISFKVPLVSSNICPT